MVARYRIFILFGLLFLFVFSTNQLKAQTLFQQVGIASSPNPVGSGARAVGMGSAFIAVADDATAASWNPAGLIQLDRPEMSIAGEHLTEQRSSLLTTVQRLKILARLMALTSTTSVPHIPSISTGISWCP